MTTLVNGVVVNVAIAFERRTYSDSQSMVDPTVVAILTVAIAFERRTYSDLL